jgi:hypothetical protein
MGPDDVAGWLAIVKEIGPVWGVLFLVAGTMFFQAKRRADTPSESAEPITRKDLEQIERRLVEVEKLRDTVFHIAVDTAEIRGLIELQARDRGKL